MFLKEKRKKFITSQFKEDGLGEKEKKSDAAGLKIPIENSRNVFGIADSSQILLEGECFFQPTSNEYTIKWINLTYHNSSPSIPMISHHSDANYLNLILFISKKIS